MSETDEQARKALATHILTDEIEKLCINLERAEIVLHEVTKRYFGVYDSSTEVGRIKITWEHKRYGILADIVSDYLHIMQRALQDLVDKETAQHGKAQS